MLVQEVGRVEGSKEIGGEKKVENKTNYTHFFLLPGTKKTGD
jgi:hypothetical protein